MNANIKEKVQIPYQLYQDLLTYFQAHATEEWSKTLLGRLQRESEPVSGEPSFSTNGEKNLDF